MVLEQDDRRVGDPFAVRHPVGANLLVGNRCRFHPHDLADASDTPSTNVDGQWYVESPMGRVGFAFVERNVYGVLDHEVTLPSGEVIYNPMRVIRDGDGCEAVFTLRRLPGMSDEEFERDAKAVAGDLARLKKIVEGRKTV